MTEKPKWTVETASFVIRQGGLVVASGSGSYEDVQRQAARYAALYRQDCALPVKVCIRKTFQRIGQRNV